MKYLLLALALPLSQAQALPSEFRSRELSCPEGQSSCDFYDRQWNMANRLTANPWCLPLSQHGDINIEAVWNQGLHGSSSMIVAVIDSGVDIKHPDLVGNIFVNEGEIPGNGIDDDDNGFVDDGNGWNFVGQNPDVSDPIGHGTHIAGVIGARGENGFGVRGINWNVRILPLVYLDKDGNGNLQNSIDAIHYAVNMGAKVINASWGGTMPDALREAIIWAETKGVLFVCSSGNDGENLDVYPYYPASFGLPNMVVVGSSAFDDAVTGDSNWGRRTVDILAPGIEIPSTLPNGRYGYMSGTSMSAPHVAGAAALLWSVHPEWTYKDVKNALLRGSVIKPPYLNRVREGRLDILASLKGEWSEKQNPDSQSWIARPENKTITVDKTSIVFETIRAPEGKLIRLRLQDIQLMSGQQRIIIEDSDGFVQQKIVASSSSLLTEYVYGKSITLRLIADSSETPLKVTIESAEYLP